MRLRCDREEDTRMHQDTDRTNLPSEDAAPAVGSPTLLCEEIDPRTGWSVTVWEDGTVTAR
jgi:hypothetical protein